ncbi:MAG: HYR domain-containing protein, partial [Bacteroidota bacterium]
LIYWHAVGEGSGDAHNSTTIDNLEDYVLNGGNLFVTGYDVVDSPDDPLMAQLLGANGFTDTPSSSDTTYLILGPANELNTGLFNIIGLMPFDAGDEDALQSLTSETVTVLDSDEGARWALRTTIGGLVAWVSTDNSGFSSWTPWETPGSGYYEALRNFAFNITQDLEPIIPTQIAGPASGESFTVGETTVSFEGVDEAGNADTCSFVVTVLDTIAPVISCISDTIYLDENGLVSDAPGENVSIIEDNCPPMSAVGDPLAIFTCDQLGVNEFNGVTRTDESGNESEPCDFTVTVLDTIAPVISCVDTTIFLDDNGLADYCDIELIDATDNCAVD